MAKYKVIDTGPKLLPVDLKKQLLPGTFEHALDYLIDHEIDLTGFDARYRNDESGASAYPPGMLMKVVLFGYAQGIVSSRGIERACREQITFIALCGDSSPHFTTIAAFVSDLGEEVARVFAQVLAICQRQGLIGHEMFAIDGVKLPSNASKGKSGTRAEFERQAAKLEVVAQTMLTRHREQDQRPAEPGQAGREAQRIERLKNEAAQVRRWLTEHPQDRKGSKGAIRKSNRTDNESAKMATSKGVIQGYCGVAAVDGKHQVIVEAQAHGTGSEQELLLPVVKAIAPLITKETCVTADAGYHSEANLKALDEMSVDALIPDIGMRKRDARFAGQEVHKAKADPLYDKNPAKPEGKFRPKDFSYDPATNTCICPAGKALHSNGSHCTTNGRTNHKFSGSLMICGPCPMREQCLRYPERTKIRQVAFFAKNQASPMRYTEAMKQRIDSPEGRALYGRRFAIVEPVFANIRHNKRMDHFTLRGRAKVDVQWKLFCLVHNIEKLAHHGYGC